MVRAMVRRSSDTSQLDGLPIEYAYADLGDADAIERACKGIDVVVHTAAAVGSFGEWEHFYETGVLGTQRLIDAAGEKWRDAIRSHQLDRRLWLPPAQGTSE
jgi:nucleoside-diphosphate-sugar epimerase